MWIYPVTMTVYYNHTDIRMAFPDTSFPAVITDDDLAYVGVYPVVQSSQPDFDPLTQKVVEQTPALINGVWTQQWGVVQLTPEEQQAAVVALVDDYTATLTAYLDQVARFKRYDNRFTCALRAGYPGPFQSEGIAFAEWMDNCNALGYTIMAEVQAGTRPLPTKSEFIAAMPVAPWGPRTTGEIPVTTP